MNQRFPYQKKAECIAEDLRSRITSGEYAQGDRLPTRAQLRSHYQVTSDTLQRALNWLIDDGFVESAGRHGTFVSETPPHLTRYALLFPNRFMPGKPTNRFFRALHDVALEVSGDRSIRICDGFYGRDGFLEYDSLLDDVSQDRLAGLIFASAPYALEGTALLADDGVPRTAIMSHIRYPHIPAVCFDYAHGAELVAERIAAAGRRRVAILVLATIPAESLTAMRQALEAHGLELDDERLLGLSISQPVWAANAVRLMFQGPPASQPDTLVVADDNLLEPATQALKALGIAIPDDLLVISYSNLPLPPATAVPVVHLGMSATDMLAACLRNIDLMRQGESAPSESIIQPRFEATQLAHVVTPAVLT